MALTLQEQADMANNGTFISRVEFAMLTMAHAVMQEEQGDKTDKHQTLRIDLALRTLRESERVARQAARFLAQFMSVTDPEAVTDIAYTQFVTLIWSRLAGFAPNDPRNQPDPEPTP